MNGFTGKPGNEHEWFRHSLPDHLLDLLDDADRARFDAHARSCPACAKLLGSALGARADWWDGAGHPSVGVLMTWTAGPLRDGARDPVREHLAQCESCRRDLEDLRGPEAVRALAPVPAPAPARRPSPAMRRRWAPATLGAAALAVAVLAVWVVGRPQRPETSPGPAPVGLAARAEPESPGPARAPQAAAPAAPVAPLVAVVVGPVEVQGADRGAEPAATPVDLPPGAGRLQLTLPALPAPDGATLTIELWSPRGERLSRQVLPAEQALRRGGVEFPAAGLATGRYSLRVSWTDAAPGDSTREYALDVRTLR